MPQISGTFMHTGQSSVPVLTLSLHSEHSYAPDLGGVYAHRAESCPKFQALIMHTRQYCVGILQYHCPPGIMMPQISDRLLPPRHSYASDLGQTSAILKRYVSYFRQTFADWKRCVWNFRLIVPIQEHDVTKSTHINGKQK